MSVFDQRNQKVKYQYNAAGDINLTKVSNRNEFAAQLEKLKGELVQAKDAKLVEEDTATEVEYNLAKAATQSKKPDPNKKSILDYLSDAKGLLAGVAALSDLKDGIHQAYEMAKSLF